MPKDLVSGCHTQKVESRRPVTRMRVGIGGIGVKLSLKLTSGVGLTNREMLRALDHMHGYAQDGSVLVNKPN